jgi:hypothetical protein
VLFRVTHVYNKELSCSLVWTHSGKTPLEKKKETKEMGDEKRLQRALHQTMYCVDSQQLSEVERAYMVLGSTGNLYQVVLGEEPECNCPDRQVICKHILFVLVKVLRVQTTDSRLFDEEWETKDVLDLFERNPLSLSRPHMDIPEMLGEIKREIQEAPFPSSPDLKRKTFEIEDCCGICCEDLFVSLPDSNSAAQLSPKEELVWCKGRCGNHFHQTCFSKLQWYNRTNGRETTCPLCRAPWWTAQVENKSKTKRKANNEGYLNFADLTGQPKRREY